MNGLSVLRRYVRRAPSEPECELCATTIPDEHPHAVDVEQGELICICAACALLFRGAVEKRFRTVPSDVRREATFTALPAWTALGIPVGLAFCFYASRSRRWLAVLPGPAGATESELDAERWAAVCASSALARALEPDVEALLVRAQPAQPAQAFAAPIDRCYTLAGILRRSWKGFDGGTEARVEVDAFFAQLMAESRLVAS